jgi:DNA-directed RNA polymerase alpha subunit
VVTAIVDKALSGCPRNDSMNHVFFMPAIENEILNQKINDLPFTEDFKYFSQKLGVNTIGEMVTIPVAEMIKSVGFTYHALQELVQFLKEKGLANLLKE